MSQYRRSWSAKGIMRPLTNHLPNVGFEFGSKQLWIDKVARLSQAEIWLEIVTDDVLRPLRTLSKQV